MGGTTVPQRILVLPMSPVGLLHRGLGSLSGFEKRAVSRLRTSTSRLRLPTIYIHLGSLTPNFKGTRATIVLHHPTPSIGVWLTAGCWSQWLGVPALAQLSVNASLSPQIIEPKVTMLREIRTPNRSTDQEPSVLRKVHKKPLYHAFERPWKETVLTWVNEYISDRVPEASTVAATEDAPTRAASHEVEELVKNLEATSLLEFESEAQGTMNEHLVSKFETWFRKQHAAATRLQESELRQDSPQTSHAAAQY
ncbi:hypothetical protein B2J93_5591 [Marssonina coronariae]|uniref:Uncharacterized protein n=1 Tax=Diplocarpon coronariae TaxID=2795749 RepID=A0A218Z3E2_9HELO|nr:hypothetical protein B2J93_5591 [Marssonina coronariae]